MKLFLAVRIIVSRLFQFRCVDSTAAGAAAAAAFAEIRLQSSEAYSGSQSGGKKYNCFRS